MVGNGHGKMIFHREIHTKECTRMALCNGEGLTHLLTEDSMMVGPIKGAREGRGNMTYKNGEKYAGYFKDNLEDGNGRYRFTNGIYREGASSQRKKSSMAFGHKIGAMPETM